MSVSRSPLGVAHANTRDSTCPLLCRVEGSKFGDEFLAGLSSRARSKQGRIHLWYFIGRRRQLLRLPADHIRHTVDGTLIAAFLDHVTRGIRDNQRQRSDGCLM